MRQRFAIQQGGLNYQFFFAKPAFGMFGDLPALLAELFSSLGQHGFRPATTHFSNAAILGDTHLQCDLPSATIKIFFDRVDLSTTSANYHKGLATTAIEAVSRYVKQLEFSTFAASCHAHGTLASTPSADFLGRFVRDAPKDPESIIGSAAVFYYGAHGPSLTSSLTLDMSAQIEGGIFVQAYVVYDASKVAASDIENVFRIHIDDVLARLDLEVAT
jgi:hypothetical protein